MNPPGTDPQLQDSFFFLHPAITPAPFTTTTAAAAAAATCPIPYHIPTLPPFIFL